MSASSAAGYGLGTSQRTEPARALFQPRSFSRVSVVADRAVPLVRTIDRRTILRRRVLKADPELEATCAKDRAALLIDRDILRRVRALVDAVGDPVGIRILTLAVRSATAAQPRIGFVGIDLKVPGSSPDQANTNWGFSAVQLPRMLKDLGSEQETSQRNSAT